MTSEPAMTPEQPEGQGTSQEMTTTRGTHFSLADVRQEMDKLWESIMSGKWSRLSVLQQTPPVDMFEKDGQVRIRAEMPGMNEHDITVEIQGNDLLISGERRDEREVKEENLYRSERSYGKFMRRISLPAGADTEQANATFKNGMLEIDMPMKPDQGKKKINVEVRG
jgi:HSP20 family protein